MVSAPKSVILLKFRYVFCFDKSVMMRFVGGVVLLSLVYSFLFLFVLLYAR